MKARELALVILNKIDSDSSYANLELKKSLNLDDNREKALATELIYGVLRYKLNLDYIRNHFSNLKENKISASILNILRIGIYQIMYLDKIPVSAACNECVKLTYKYGNKGAVGFVNGVLRSVARNKDNIKYPSDKIDFIVYKYSFPHDIIEMWVNDYGLDVTTNIAEALNQNKGVSIRANELKLSTEQVENLLKQQNIEFVKQENSFKIKRFSADDISGFNEGFFTIQDLASMKAVELLNPEEGDNVLDLCAAPGGKSCYIAQLMKNNGKIVSCDIHKHRAELINKTAQRLGVKIINTLENDATVINNSFLDSFNKVLVDAPCSGLGVIANKPDIKWSKQNFDSLAQLQYNILKMSSNYVKNGGELVYSTCTINKKENQDVVEKVLTEDNTLKLISDYIQLLPQDGTDGFFMCKLLKI